MIQSLETTAPHGAGRRALAVAVVVGLAGLATVRHRAPSPLLHTTILAQRPCAVAVDPQTGHAFVVTGGVADPGQVTMGSE